MIGSQNNLPAYVTTNTAIRTMTKALNRYVPGTVSSPNYSPYTTTVWAAGMLFAAAGTHISADSAPLSTDTERTLCPTWDDSARIVAASDIQAEPRYNDRLLVLHVGAKSAIRRTLGTAPHCM